MKKGNVRTPTVVALDPPSASKPARSFGILALASLLLLPSMSHAIPITTPTGLPPGSSYRLAFVTSGTHDAISTDIADYDAFVTAEANTEVALSSSVFGWQVIGSTASVAAIDHTHTPTSTSGIPIYLLNGQKLADDYADLWDGSVDIPLQIDQHGMVVAVGTGLFTFTGTLPSGAQYGGRELGTANNVIAGNPPLIDTRWITATNGNPLLGLPYYALSAILVVPEPDPAAFLILACAALLLVRRVRAE